MVLPHRSRNGRPWVFESKYTLNRIAFEQFSALWIQNTRLDAEERHGGTARLGRDGTGEGSDDDRPGLRLPECVYDSTLGLSDVLVVPVPRLGVNGLANGPEDPQRGEVVVLDMLGAQTTEQADGGGC